jgi:hypothetical protein
MEIKNIIFKAKQNEITILESKQKRGHDVKLETY